MYLSVPPYSELLNEMTSALEANTGVITLTGAGGTGKSAFCNMLVRVLRQLGQQVVYFLHPPHSLQELQDAVRQQLSLPATTPFEDSLAAWQATRTKAHQRLILLIDDAQTMDSALLATLADLAGDHLNLLLVGADGLADVLKQPQMQRPAVRSSRRFRLLPLTLAQLRMFVREFMLQHDASAPAPDDAALKKLLQTTAGLPGNVAKQLKASVDRAAANQAGEPLLDLVLSTAKRPVRGSRRHARWHVAVSFSVIAIALLSLLFTRDTEGPQTEASLSEPAAANAGNTTVRNVDGEAAGTGNVTTATTAVERTPTVVATPPVAAEVVPAVAPDATIAGATEEDIGATLEAATPVAPASAFVNERPLQAQPLEEQSAVISESHIESLLADWTRAWQQQDLAGYFAAYGTSFVPANGLTRERWEADRTRIIGNARDIRISWRDLVWRLLDSDTVAAELALDYEAAGYRDVTRKRLLLRREEDGVLRITEEQNLAVERR